MNGGNEPPKMTKIYPKVIWTKPSRLCSMLIFRSVSSVSMGMYGVVLWCWFVPILSEHWYGLVDSTTFHWHFTIHIRTASMYGIFPYVYHLKNQPNIGKYSHTWMVKDILRIPTIVPSSFIDGNYWLITPHLPASLATLRMSPKAPYGFDPAGAIPRWRIGWMVDGSEGTKKAFHVLKVQQDT